MRGIVKVGCRNDVFGTINVWAECDHTHWVS